MNKQIIRKIGKLIIAGVFLMVFTLGCEDNKKRRSPSYYGTYGSRGTNPNYTDPYGTQGQNFDPRGGMSPMNMGPDGGINGDPRLGGQPGNMGPGRGTGPGNVPLGPLASDTYPYVIDLKTESWKQNCQGKWDHNFDGDLYCDEEDLDHENYNGFKVGGIRLKSEDVTFTKILDNNKNADFNDLLHSCFANAGTVEGGGAQNPGNYDGITYACNSKRLKTKRSVRSENEYIYVISGSAGQAGNWGTKIKNEYKSGSAMYFPAEEEAGHRDSTKGNKLIEGSKNNGRFPGMAAIDNKYSYMICHSGWFTKDPNSSETSFKIQNSGSRADDAVFIRDNGAVVAYSVNKHWDGFFGNLIQKIAGSGKKNALEFSVTDSDPHLLEFCFMNERIASSSKSVIGTGISIRKDAVQGEVRMWVDTDDENYGYEPINPKYFTVVAPHGRGVESIQSLELLRFSEGEESYYRGGAGSEDPDKARLIEILEKLKDSCSGSATDCIDPENIDAADQMAVIILGIDEKNPKVTPESLANMKMVIQKMIDKYNVALDNYKAGLSVELEELKRRIAELKAVLAKLSLLKVTEEPLK